MNIPLKIKILGLIFLACLTPAPANADASSYPQELMLGLKPFVATTVQFDLSANKKMVNQKLNCRFQLVENPSVVATGVVNLDANGRGKLVDLIGKPMMLATGAKYRFELSSNQVKVVKLDFTPMLTNNILKPDSLTVGDPLGI